MAITKHTAGSPEVQKEVTNIFNVYHFPYETKIKMVNNIKNAFVKPEIIEEFDGGNKRGVGWFISRSIEIFLENINNNQNVKRG